MKNIVNSKCYFFYQLLKDSSLQNNFFSVDPVCFVILSNNFVEYQHNSISRKSDIPRE